MNLCRNQFLDALAKESASLGTVFMNHSGSTDKLRTDLSSIDLLVDKSSENSFVHFCRTNPLVQQITFTSGFLRTPVLISFEDGSELKFKLIRNLFRSGMKMLPVHEIREKAYVNTEDMFVPVVWHHYDYLLLKYQLAGIPFPDRYQKYFSSLDSKNRTAIFRYVQSKYNLVFNTIEELYQPSETTALKIMIGVRKRKENPLFLMAFRSIAYLFHRIFSFLRKPRVIHVNHQVEKTNPPVEQAQHRRVVL